MEREAAHARLSVHLSKCHIVGNHMSRLKSAGQSSSSTQLRMWVMKIVHIQGNSHSLDPDQDQQNVGPDMDPNHLTLTMIAFLKESSVVQLFAKVISGLQN